MACSSFDLVGFDLDGTLVDTAHDLANAANHALATLGLAPLEVTQVKRFVGRGARLMLQRALAVRGGTPDAVEGLYPIFIDYYAAHIAEYSKPYPGVDEALDQLANAGLRLAICTNKREALARHLIDKLGWTSRFDAIVGGDTVEALKPDPSPLQAMIAQAGGGSTLFVGDSDNDVGAAKAAGLQCVLFQSGYGDPHAACTLEPDSVMTDFIDLPKLVLNWAA